MSPESMPAEAAVGAWYVSSGPGNYADMGQERVEEGQMYAFRKGEDGKWESHMLVSPEVTRGFRVYDRVILPNEKLADVLPETANGGVYGWHDFAGTTGCGIIHFPSATENGTSLQVSFRPNGNIYWRVKYRNAYSAWKQVAADPNFLDPD
ncbi:MAG: hypothetical protein K2N86_03895, partial [Rikenellaceae bacterium]|nr:hypothetical protein [Rikenellaceae bacterium]